MADSWQSGTKTGISTDGAKIFITDGEIWENHCEGEEWIREGETVLLPGDGTSDDVDDDADDDRKDVWEGSGEVENEVTDAELGDGGGVAQHTQNIYINRVFLLVYIF